MNNTNKSIIVSVFFILLIILSQTPMAKLYLGAIVQSRNIDITYSYNGCGSGTTSRYQYSVNGGAYNQGSTQLSCSDPNPTQTLRNQAIAYAGITEYDIVYVNKVLYQAPEPILTPPNVNTADVNVVGSPNINVIVNTPTNIPLSLSYSALDTSAKDGIYEVKMFRYQILDSYFNPIKTSDWMKIVGASPYTFNVPMTPAYESISFVVGTIVNQKYIFINNAWTLQESIEFRDIKQVTAKSTIPTATPTPIPTTTTQVPSPTPSSTEGALIITSQPTFAGIIIDGQDKHRATDASFIVTPGSHTVVLFNVDYQNYTKTVQVGSGQTVRIDAVLTPKTTPIAVHTVVINPVRTVSPTITSVPTQSTVTTTLPINVPQVQVSDSTYGIVAIIAVIITIIIAVITFRRK